MLTPSLASAHGTAVYPKSRVRRIYEANPSNPAFPLAASAVQMDGALSYYTWNEVSRLVPSAVAAGLPPGFDYSQWMPDGAIASAGRVLANSPCYPRTYLGLDQISEDWPTTPLTGGATITVDFYATAPHVPGVFDVWITKPGWNPTMPLIWGQMEFLSRPANPTLTSQHFYFDVTIPSDRSGHHVLWIAWQRNDPAGEVFISTSDIVIRTYPGSQEDFELATGVNSAPSAFPDVKPINTGDALSVTFGSPNSTYNGTIPALFATVFPTGVPHASIMGFPEVHIDPTNFILVFDGGGGLGPVIPLPPSGLAFSATLVPGLSGSSIQLQALAIAPSTFTGHAITVTDGHEIRVN